MTSKTHTLFFLLLFTAFLFISDVLYADTSLRRHFDAFAEKDNLEYASWGFAVYDVTAGTVILEHNSNQRLVPASTQKVLTATSALFMLGHDYLYETTLQHDGEITETGVLEGNLYIKGSGDPAFGTFAIHDSLSLDSVYARWETALQDKGIRRIEGHIIADERIFDGEMVPPRWIWSHIGNYFGAGSSGLTVHENEYTVYFDAGEALGDPARVSHTDPLIADMSFVNDVTTGYIGSGDQVYIYGAPYSSERHLTGTVPLGAESFPVRGSMPDPPLFAAQSLKDHLAANDIEVSGQATTYRRAALDGVIPFETRNTISSWHSPPMFDLIYRTNMSSVNTYAENLLKTIGSVKREEGSRVAGLQAVSDHWDAYNIEPGLGTLHDGSGLSTSNRLTINQLMTVMIAAYHHPTFNILYNSLPLAGYSGSLANHLRGSASEGVLRAKSGFLNNVMAYAGFTPMQNGNLAAFVVIVNDYDGNAAGMRNEILHLLNSITTHDGRAL